MSILLSCASVPLSSIALNDRMHNFQLSNFKDSQVACDFTCTCPSLCLFFNSQLCKYFCPCRKTQLFVAEDKCGCTAIIFTMVPKSCPCRKTQLLAGEDEWRMHWLVVAHWHQCSPTRTHPFYLYIFSTFSSNILPIFTETPISNGIT